MKRIKGCPFCGSAPKIECVCEGTPCQAYFIKCSNKKCETTVQHPFNTIEEAVAYWMNRTNAMVDVPDDFFKYESKIIKMDIPEEVLTEIYNEISLNFGESAAWTALVLLPMIDIESWKFPDYTHQIDLANDIMKYIEGNEKLKNIMQKNTD